MAMKGLFFSIDAVFGVIIAMMIVVASLFVMARSQEDKFSTLFLSRFAQDVLVSMDKNRTLDTLNSSAVNATLTKALPSNLEYVLSVKVFQCSGSGCSSSNELTSKSFTVSLNPSSESNPVIAKRAFLTFDNNHVQYFNTAELRVWLR